MFIVTQPSHFQVTAETSVPYISQTGGSGKNGRRPLAVGPPGGTPSYLNGADYYKIYDEYLNSVPDSPVLPTMGSLWLKANTFLSVHYFSVQNNFPLGINTTSLLPGFFSHGVARVRDVPYTTFYSYPNFKIIDNLYEGTKAIFNSEGFRESILVFLETKYNLSVFPTKFSVKLLISWAKYTNKVRFPPPDYTFTPSDKERKFRLDGIWAEPNPNAGVGFLHSIYIYR